MEKSFEMPRKTYLKKHQQLLLGRPRKQTNCSLTVNQNVVNNLENVRMPTQDSVKVHRNVPSNKDRSHKIMWKLPEKCLEEKCDV